MLQSQTTRIGRSIRHRWWTYFTRNLDEVHLRFDGDLKLFAPVRNLSTKYTFVKRYKDPDVFAWMDRFLRPGMTVLDVGANVGTYTLFIAKRVGPSGRVIAVEPGTANLRYLKANVETNNFSQVTIAPVAVGSDSGAARLILVPANAGKNHIALDSEPTEAADQVQVARLDDLVAQLKLGAIDFVKMDIEGFEGHALRGFSKTLSEQSPVLLIEHARASEPSYGFPREENIKFLTELGYEPKMLVHGSLKTYDWEHSAEDTFWIKD